MAVDVEVFVVPIDGRSDGVAGPNYVGDMNAVRNAQERFGTTLNSIEADHFNSFIDSTGLVDLPIGGRSFTWMNKAGTKLSKLDRFLISEDDAFLQFYKRKFQAQDSQVMFSNLPHSHSLNCMDRETLERQVTLEEIKEAVWDCGSSKAPGPDGYSFAFVKKNSRRLLSSSNFLMALGYSKRNHWCFGLVINGALGLSLYNSSSASILIMVAHLSFPLSVVRQEFPHGVIPLRGMGVSGPSLVLLAMPMLNQLYVSSNADLYRYVELVFRSCVIPFFKLLLGILSNLYHLLACLL
ncbi:RNA-directed DNA polymerase, eukaryota, reverse transcriptase zinc-binding domain protein [Tanacetum coccineum]|uniref:RNA-directed DNA polymerase, eukaryota, reverse transcriptase zinc-binding domain protein n=1 Tax=Tanacetum coccineum TaxID=301880 RepID=A0ABQ5EBS9_9ASTR